MQKRLTRARMHLVIARQVKKVSIVQITALERRETFQVHAIAAIRNAPTRQLSSGKSWWRLPDNPVAGGSKSEKGRLWNHERP